MRGSRPRQLAAVPRVDPAHDRESSPPRRRRSLSTSGTADVAIVGAGAAGLAAARRLSERRPAWRTACSSGGAPWRAGPHHRAPRDRCPPRPRLRLAARRREATPGCRSPRRSACQVDRTPAPWDVQHRDLGFPPEDQAASTRRPPRPSRRDRRQRRGIRLTALPRRPPRTGQSVQLALLDRGERLRERCRTRGPLVHQFLGLLLPLSTDRTGGWLEGYGRAVARRTAPGPAGDAPARR